MPDSAAGEIDREFLVAYDYGMGGLWAIVMAPSQEAITSKYPELAVASERPPWMDDQMFEKLQSEPLWLDDPPSGILNALITDRRSKSDS
jgi:hypothetical protein